MPINRPARVARTILTDVVGKLANSTDGFNAQLVATIAANPQYIANAGFLTNIPLVFPVNFTGCSQNVTLSPVGIDDWISTSNVTIGNVLLMQIYVINATNQQHTHGMIFDGVVNIGIDCHVMWSQQAVIYDFDAATSAVEDTLYAIFNTILPASYTVWSQGVIYNGRLSVPSRSRLVRGGPGWLQLSTATLQLGYQIKAY